MICRKQGCSNEVTDPKQVYCSRDCAPYGYYGLNQKEVKALRTKEGTSEPKRVYSQKISSDGKTPDWILQWRMNRKMNQSKT